MNVLNRKSLVCTLAAITLLVLSACGDRITQRECFGDTTVRCRDFAIRQQVAKVAQGIERLKAREDSLALRMGQANYDRLLDLAKERLAGIEDSRPSWYLRWFAADREWWAPRYVFAHEAEFLRLAAQAQAADRADPPSPTQASADVQQKCVDAKVAAFRKEVGQEPLVTFDMVQEWKVQCGGK